MQKRKRENEGEDQFLTIPSLVLFLRLPPPRPLYLIELMFRFSRLYALAASLLIPVYRLLGHSPREQDQDMIIVKPDC